MTDNIVKLKVAKRPTDTVIQLKRIEIGECQHYNGPFYYDEKLSEVTCGCGAKLNPIWVIAQLGRQESRWVEGRKAYLQLKAEHEQRWRCKCQHCGKMTRIRGM
jgi:hypothetical protein